MYFIYMQLHILAVLPWFVYTSHIYYVRYYSHLQLNRDFWLHQLLENVQKHVLLVEKVTSGE